MLKQEARNLGRLFVGSPLFAAQHLLRLRYLDRDGEVDDTLPPDQAATNGSPVQLRKDGFGPVVIRRYAVEIAHPDGHALIDEFRRTPNSFVPHHVAGFLRGDTAARNLELGDELTVEIPGPWNGPIRVDELDESGITFITLDGHMEAGKIRFESEPTVSGSTVFSITSWARAGDPAFEVAHVEVPIAAELQLATWAHTCDRAVAISANKRISPIRCATRELNESEDP